MSGKAQAQKSSSPARRREAESEPPSLYLVGDCPIRHDEDRYEPSDEIELTEAQAKRLGTLVAPAPATSKE